MAKLLKLRRGTTSQHGSFTGAEGEVTVDTDKETLVVHDGSTAGGHPVAAEDMANVSSASIVGRLGTGSILQAKLEADIIDGTKLADDAVDSEHYVDASIDHQHLANDCIDGDNIQDDVINSEHIAAGAVDLEHMSSESVDEDNLHISNAGTNGQFLQKQSGNTGGLTWATVSQTPEGTAVLSTGESGGTKFLREDGDNSCSWQTIPVPTTITVADESSDTTCNVLFTTAATGDLAPKSGDNLTFNSSTGELEADIIKDSKGNVRNIPQLSKSAQHTLVAADSGKHVFSSTGGWILNASTDFAIGDAVTLINNSGSNQTLTVTGATCYNAADAATGNRTLAGRGMATLICVADDTYHISGAGLS